MPPIIYAIRVNENRSEILKVLKILFAHGYVFDTNKRLRTTDSFLKWYDGDFIHWKWIVLNTDSTCKAVVTAYYDIPYGFIGTTAEAFIELKLK